MTDRRPGPPCAEPGLDPWNLGPTCPDCAIPLVPREDMPRPEACDGPMGCPCCGEPCNGTYEQIDEVMRLHALYEASTDPLAGT